MKRIVCLLAAAVMLFAACGKTENTSTPSSSSVETEIDLTVMSSTMVYSQVYDMINNTAKYEGKSVKMKGVYYPSDNGVYHFCVIADATSCCQQGIEFILKEGEYPENGAELTISGTFETYYEGEDKYCHINNAVYC